MNSSGKYFLAIAVAIILVAGALTLPLAFDHQMADAKKKKSSKKYKGSSSSSKSTKKAEIEAIGGHGGSAGAGGISSGGNAGSSSGFIYEQTIISLP